MKIDKQLISRLEHLARLELSETEKEVIRKDLNDILVLKWFSDGFYSMIEEKEGLLYLGDLRYGNAPSNYDRPEDYIFIFRIDARKKPLSIQSIRNRDDDMSKMFGVLWNRITGI